MTDLTRTSDWFPEGFFRVPVIAVFRGLSASEAVRLSERAWDVGVEHVEIPIQTSDAIPVLQAVAKAAADRGLVIGAGTVVSIAQLDAAAAAGVGFTVSPALDSVIVTESARRGIPHLPGIATASEILQAKSLGLTWLKTFPASILGPQWAKAMKGPYPEVNFVATGGVNADTAGQFLSSGTSVVGLSGAFADDRQLEIVRTLIAATASAHLSGAASRA